MPDQAGIVNRKRYIPRMSSTWAVTGATGLVGNNLVRRLCADGARPRALVRSRGGAPGSRRELAGVDVQVVDGDLAAGPLAELVRDTDVVVHAAANVWVGTTGGEEMERVNVGGTRLVCEAMLAEVARRAEVAGRAGATPAPLRLVQVSSVDALGLGTREAPANEDTAPREAEANVAYVATKRAADRVVREAITRGLDAVFVYPTYMIGPWDWRPSSGKMVLEIARGKGLFAPAGGNNFVDVRDVVEGLLRVARDAPSGSAWVLGNENLSYREAWTRMARVVGARAPLGELPRWIGLTAAAFLELPLALGLREGEINPATTRMSFLPHYFDPTRARTTFALPSTPLETAVADAWAWFQANGYT